MMWPSRSICYARRQATGCLRGRSRSFCVSCASWWAQGRYENKRNAQTVSRPFVWCIVCPLHRIACTAGLAQNGYRGQQRSIAWGGNRDLRQLLCCLDGGLVRPPAVGLSGALHGGRWEEIWSDLLSSPHLAYSMAEANYVSFVWQSHSKYSVWLIQVMHLESLWHRPPTSRHTAKNGATWWCLNIRTTIANGSQVIICSAVLLQHISNALFVVCILFFQSKSLQRLRTRSSGRNKSSSRTRGHRKADNRILIACMPF